MKAILIYVARRLPVPVELGKIASFLKYWSGLKFSNPLTDIRTAIYHMSYLSPTLIDFYRSIHRGRGFDLSIFLHHQSILSSVKKWVGFPALAYQYDGVVFSPWYRPPFFLSQYTYNSPLLSHELLHYFLWKEGYPKRIWYDEVHRIAREEPLERLPHEGEEWRVLRWTPRKEREG